jgi:hypothetical protein
MGNTAGKTAAGMIVLGLIVGVAGSARADLIFNATGTFDNGAQLSGTVTIDTVMGVVTSANLLVSGPGLADLTFDVLESQGTDLPHPGYFFNMLQTSGTEIPFLFLGLFNTADHNPPNLVDYPGGPFILAHPPFFGLGSEYFDTQDHLLISGSLTPVPEPSSLMIVGLGGALALGYAWCCRRWKA